LLLFLIWFDIYVIIFLSLFLHIFLFHIWLLFVFLFSLTFVLLKLVLFPVDFGLFISCPQRKVMENNTCCNRHIQACSLVSILWNIDKKVTQLPMNRNNSSAFITHKESCVSCKRLLMNGNTTLSNLNTTHSDVILVQVFFCLLEVLKSIELYLLVRAVIAEDMKLLHGFHFLAVLWLVGYVDNLLQTKSTCASYYWTDIVFLSDIVEEQVSFRELFFHFFYQLFVFFIKIQNYLSKS